MYTTTRPIILSFSGNSYLPGYYYYYRVLANGLTVYFGKTFCQEVDGVPTIELDLRRILQANAYDGQYSLKPVYNNTKQVYSPLFPTQYKFANTDIMQRYTLRIESDTAETVVAQTDLVVTSAYDLIDEMPQPPSIYRFIQPLSYETSLIPSYPNVVTDKYGIFFFIEFSGNFTDTSQSTYWIYLLDSSTWSTYNYPLALYTTSLGAC